MKIKWNAGRAKADPEKTLLPTLMWINTNHKSYGKEQYKGCVLAIGWWDYWMGVTVSF